MRLVDTEGTVTVGGRGIDVLRKRSMGGER